MWKTLFSMVFVGLLSAACIWGVVHTVGEDAPDKGHIPPARLPRVSVYKMKPPEAVRYIRVTGEVLTDADNRILAPLDGVVQRVLAKTGQTVKAGTPIAELDDTALREQYQQAQIQFGLAQGRLQVLEVKGSKDVERLKVARANVIALTERMDDIEALIEGLVIKMPKAGRVGEFPLKPGETVKAGDILTTVETGNGPLIEAYLPVDDYERLKPEQKITILLRSAHSTASIHGSWRPSTESVAPDSLMRTIWVHPPTLQRKLLKASQHVDLLVPVAGMGILQAPETAIQWQNGEAWVYVIQKDDGVSRVEGRKVTVGETVEDQVEIIEGLMAGDMIVLEGASLLHNRQEVAVMGADVLESASPF